MKTKVIIVYILTFLVILSNIPLFNGETIIEIVLSNFGINTFYSQGDTGLYYPTIAMFLIGLCFWLFLLKIVPKTKYSRDYFYYCFGMMVLIAVVKNAFM